MDKATPVFFTYVHLFKIIIFIFHNSLLCSSKLKGGLILQSFSTLKKWTKSLTWAFPPKEKMRRIEIWHIFLKAEDKVKNILRLGHL